MQGMTSAFSENLSSEPMKLKSIAIIFRSARDGLPSFAKLEIILAFLCVLLPLFLILCDGGPVKDCISDYYNMNNNQVYYFLLTVAALLFIFDGVVTDKHFYNAILGIALAGVILFPGAEFHKTHLVFAIIFFIGNPIVFVVFTSKKQRWFKWLMGLGIVISLLVLCLIFKAITLFFAEWISLTIIATHFILESWGIID